MEKIDSNIHFTWLGKITRDQIRYIKTWAYANKNNDYQINMWYDSEAVLINLLKEEIKKNNLK